MFRSDTSSTTVGDDLDPDGPSGLSPCGHGSQTWSKGGIDSDTDEGLFEASTGDPAFGEWGVPADLKKIHMGPLLARGNFGKVYRGAFDASKAVAVKVSDLRDREDEVRVQALCGVKLQQGLDHTGIVKMISYGVFYEADGSGDAEDRLPKLIWVVQELCDMGNLASAALSGLFRQGRDDQAACVTIVLPTMGDIAGGMMFLHQKGIVHANLTSRNVLLMRSESRRHGFVAKIGDFSTARLAGHGKPLCAGVLNTMTHVPPELRLNGMLYPSADVWAYGFIGWEAFCGRSADRWGPPLEWPEATPEAFCSLMRACLDLDQEGRPSFADIALAVTKQQMAIH